MDAFGSDPRQTTQLSNHHSRSQNHTPNHNHTSAQGPTHAELLMTANDLYARLESDPSSFADEDAYWSTLPLHLQTYVRNILPFSTANKGTSNSLRLQTHAWLQAAQQACDCPTCRQGRSLSTLAAAAFPGSYPSDPGMLSDPNFAAIALENLPIGPNHTIGDHPLDHLSASDINMFNTFANNPNAYDEGVPGYPNDYDADDIDADDLDVEVDVDVITERGAQFTLSYDGGMYPHVNGNHLDNDSVSGKKNKKKKKKGKGGELPAATPTHMPVAAPQPIAPAPAPTAPPSFPVPPVPTTQPHLNPPPTVAHALPPSNPAPAPSVHPAPPARQPSSRAQGKQPMQYTNPPPPAPSPAPPASTGSRRTNSKLHHTLDHNHNHGATPAAKTEPAKNSKLWNTNSQQERERIKEFWLALQEHERRALVKVEKETVLKKMKEQQKHSCSCAVCGRKRHAIESELESLYDQYYLELEVYAKKQEESLLSGGAVPPPGPGPFPGSVELDKNGAPVLGHVGKTAAAARKTLPQPRPPAVAGEDEEYDDEEEEDEEYDDEEGEEDEEYDEEEEDDEDAEDDDVDAVDKPRARKGPRKADAAKPANGDVFGFGNSLTVKDPGGILTVADDLLKNDGQKFLEMMEQLAKRRMMREKEAAAAVGEDESDEEDEEDDDEEDEEEEEEEEEDEEDDEEEEELTEQQKMEEGRRMFQIFAARMFEQRVLQAYRERVAQERQLQLLRELEEEDKLEKEKRERKEKENQKKKDKKKQQKQAKEEERARKEAEKAAEEAAAKAKQEALEEELRKKREEERLKREAEKKARDEEKQRKEEERRKRIAEEREREAEAARKKKEKEERLKQERLERERKEREEKERKAKEDEARREKERKEREEREKAEKERREKEAKEKAEKEAKEKEAQEKARAAALAAAKAQALQTPIRPAAPAQPAKVPVIATRPSPSSSSASGQTKPMLVSSSSPSAARKPQAKPVAPAPAGPSTTPPKPVAPISIQQRPANQPPAPIATPVRQPTRPTVITQAGSTAVSPPQPSPMLHQPLPQMPMPLPGGPQLGSSSGGPFMPSMMHGQQPMPFPIGVNGQMMPPRGLTPSLTPQPFAMGSNGPIPMHAQMGPISASPTVGRPHFEPSDVYDRAPYTSVPRQTSAPVPIGAPRNGGPSGVNQLTSGMNELRIGSLDISGIPPPPSSSLSSAPGSHVRRPSGDPVVRPPTASGFPSAIQRPSMAPIAPIGVRPGVIGGSVPSASHSDAHLSSRSGSPAKGSAALAGDPIMPPKAGGSALSGLIDDKDELIGMPKRKNTVTLPSWDLSSRPGPSNPWDSSGLTADARWGLPSAPAPIGTRNNVAPGSAFSPAPGLPTSSFVTSPITNTPFGLPHPFSTPSPHQDNSR